MTDETSTPADEQPAAFTGSGAPPEGATPDGLTPDETPPTPPAPPAAAEATEEEAEPQPEPTVVGHLVVQDNVTEPGVETTRSANYGDDEATTSSHETAIARDDAVAADDDAE